MTQSGATTAGGLQLCAVFPTNGIGNDVGAIRAFAQTAEELGYSQVLIYDHLLVPASSLENLYESSDLEIHTSTSVARRSDRSTSDGRVPAANDFHEALTVLSFFAGITSRIQLVTGILVLPMRQTALVAKQVAEIQILSEGRLVLGVGVGWNPVEFQAMGMPLQRRGERLEEQLKVLHLLLEEEVAEFKGKYHQIEACGMNPKPEVSVPIWMGGTLEKAYARAARYADGFIFHGPPSRDDVNTAVPDILEHLNRQNREKDGFALECMVDYSIAPRGWQKEIQHWRELGGTHVALRSMDMTADYFGVPKNNFSRPHQYIDALEIFAREVA